MDRNLPQPMKGPRVGCGHPATPPKRRADAAPPSAALQLFVCLLGKIEPGLSDDLQKRVFNPCYVAACEADLPANRARAYSVAVPAGTLALKPDAFAGCTTLTEVTLPAKASGLRARVPAGTATEYARARFAGRSASHAAT